MAWIEDADRIDRAIAGAGVPDDIRMKAMAEIMTVLARENTAREKRDRDAQAARLLPLGASLVAERQCCHRSTAYRRAKRAHKVARNLLDATPA